MLKLVQRSRDSQLDLAGNSWLASRQKLHTCQACREAEPSCQLQHYRTKILVWLFSYLAAGTLGPVKSRGQAASQLCFKKLTLRIPLSPQYIYPLYPRNVESFQRETLRKTRLTHLQSSHKDSSNSSTFTLSIVTSLRGTLPKPFFTIPTSVRRPFGVWEAIRKGLISYWLMLQSVAESGKLKKKQVRLNLVGLRAWRAQVHWVDQAQMVFCYSCIPTTFFSGLFTAWRAAERFYVEGFGFLFDNTSCVVLVFASLFR